MTEVERQEVTEEKLREMSKTEKLRTRPEERVSGYSRRIRVEVERTRCELGGDPAGIIMGCCIEIRNVY